MASGGVDGSVELAGELDRLSGTSSIASNAPRSPKLYEYLRDGMNSASEAEAFTSLTVGLMERLGIWWSSDLYAALPVMVPWCVRDRSCRYDQGPEEWGAARSDGLFRDDNSIIKQLPKPQLIGGPDGSLYQGRKLWRGFTGCHIWRDLPNGKLAGADPWLYSFMPNLVWLPKWIAPLTDRQGSEIQSILQRTSIAIFRGAKMRQPLTEYAENAWLKLPAPQPGNSLQLEHLSRFEPTQSFVSRRVKYFDKLIKGCDDILSTGATPLRLVCSKYRETLTALEADELRRFRDTLDQYRVACSNSP